MSCLIAFLTMPIAMGINLGHLVGTFLEWFQNNIRNAEMVCSKTVIKQTFYGKVLEKIVMLALEKFENKLLE